MMTTDDPQKPSDFVYGKETYREMEARQYATMSKRRRKAHEAQQRLYDMGYGRPSMSGAPLTPGSFFVDMVLWWKYRAQAAYLRHKARPLRRTSGQ